MNLTGNILHKTKNSSLNILCQSTHEAVEAGLCECFPEHTWYCIYSDNTKTWNETFRKCPHNYIILKNGRIPPEVNISMVISQNKFGQFSNLYPTAKRYNLPFVSFEHTYPYIGHWSNNQLAQLKQMRGDINLFISDDSQKAWGWDKSEAKVIEHYIESDKFAPDNNVAKNPYILSVCNQFSKPVRFVPCNFPLWQEIIKPNTKEQLPWRHIGDDKGFSLPAKNEDDLIQEYQKAQVFINTSRFSPIPHSLLEAASCGVPIVSTSTCAIPDIFKHGETALLSNDPAELRHFCLQLLNNEALRKRLGDNSRQMIKERFNKEKYINSWNQVFEQVRKL